MLLQTPVSKKMVKDYNDFVTVSEEMYIKIISGVLSRAQYVTHEEFRADVHQILKNAQKYNLSMASLCACPGNIFCNHLSLLRALLPAGALSTWTILGEASADMQHSSCFSFILCIATGCPHPWPKWVPCYGDAGVDLAMFLLPFIILCIGVMLFW